MVKKVNKKIIELEKDKNQKWTKNEISSMDKQTRYFIRGIQVKEKIGKKAAIKRYLDYKTGNIKNRALFRRKVAKAMLPDYTRKEHKEPTGEKKIKKVKVEGEKVVEPKKKKVSKKKSVFSKLLLKKDVIIKLESGGYSERMTKIMNKNRENFPNDTLYQWQHGHNAKPPKKKRKRKIQNKKVKK